MVLRLIHTTGVTLTGKMGMQPILPVTVTVKKTKGAARQHCGDGDSDARCGCTATLFTGSNFTFNHLCFSNTSRSHKKPGQRKFDKKNSFESF